MYEENPVMHIDDLLEEAMFDGHVLGKNIAGTPSSVLAMTRHDVVTYHTAHYRPESMVIVASGRVTDDTLAQLEKTFGTVPASSSSRSTCAVFDPAVIAPRIRFQTKPVEQVQLALGFPSVGRAHADEPALKLLSVILGGTMSSRLFVEVREKRGLCYSVRASTDAYQDTGIFSVRAGLDASRVEEAITVICDELENVSVCGVTEEELTMVKDHVRGGLALSLEDSSDRAEYYGRQALFLDEIQDPQDRLKRFDTVTREDVIRVARQYLNRDMMSLAVIGPYSSEEEIRRLIPHA